MRFMIKSGGKWIQVEAPTSPEDISSWMYRHDGTDAVVVDDQKGLYYCGNENVLQQYRSHGMNAEMFSALDRILSGRYDVTP